MNLPTNVPFENPTSRPDVYMSSGFAVYDDAPFFDWKRPAKSKIQCEYCSNDAILPTHKPTRCKTCWEHEKDLTSWNSMFCLTCGEATHSFCGRCRIRRYCCVKCQQMDWETHKLYCVENSYKFAGYVDIDRLAMRCKAGFLQDEVNRLEMLNQGRKRVYCTILIAYLTKALHLQKRIVCCVCMDKEASRAVFVPCGHRCVCDFCAARAKEVCPICRQSKFYATVNALRWDQKVFVVE